ncbi:Alpha/Beta hydrolase protein [Dendryphion nanum]|uniref:Alpha/Beta hydrolase protein n=1 Tax=Dendryphion nanum TaxID=256645 RepID=A0A9P9E075_9PLEO|nr:Alpha/Beta hydrolase protein [Dendryphion nanum]
MFPLAALFTILLCSTSAFHVSASPHNKHKSKNESSLPGNVHVYASKIAPGAYISYKQTYICETTPGVRSFSGYINIPSSQLDGFGGRTEYNASMFFWYFESRNKPKSAPLSLYLGGGPGTSSLMGATIENGPCYINGDSNSTTLNPWSWNNKVNMLYVDQPVQTGFSFDKKVPSMLDLLTGLITPANGSTLSNGTSVYGLLPSQDGTSVANTTDNAAHILWKFSQIWLQEFREHKSSDDRVSIWGNSYGGHWVPAAVEHFQSQNEKIQNGRLNGICAKKIRLDTLGVTNGCVDLAIEGQYYPEFAFNNTYGFQAYSEDVYKDAKNNFTKPGGCRDMVDKCHVLAKESDPHNVGTNDTVNKACADASMYCFESVQGAYELSGRNVFDLALEKPAIFPPDYIVGYLNQGWVQNHLGVPLNFSLSSDNTPKTYFGLTGDVFKVTIDTINRVAQRGTKIALVFGDRDYRCNWLGGEAISLAMSYPAAPQFRAAGYQYIGTNSNARAGVVRQHDKVSFSRVFDAGHAVGAYQPEAVSEIFDRVMFDGEVATGREHTANNTKFTSTGPASSFHMKNTAPKSPKNECYLWLAYLTCTKEELAALANGTAVVENFILKSIM